ncbi:MAG: S-methyl-5-thioribose-1-phosphate isomerase [Planctomycetota bacterium]
MAINTLKWIGGIDGYLVIIDQRRLPAEYKIVRCVNARQLYNAIKTLAVRGAPAIGVAAAFGAVLALKGISAKATPREVLTALKLGCKYLASSRPTAVNLQWALDRIEKCAKDFVKRNPSAKPAQLRGNILAQANAIFEEDVEMCLKIGRNGAKFVKPVRRSVREVGSGFSILTHCNAGALATAGQGTALSVLYEAKKQGKRFKVYADESRPLLQGSRLTAWELKQAGIDVTVICDDMAGALMKQSKIDMVIVGADRIAANGDAANKIGTYSLSVLAKAHRIPFYVAAPSSTFDLKTKTGNRIPIEQRPAEEVRFCGGKQIAPDGVKIYNPAFDVTPAKNITAIITERGVIEKPDARKISTHLANKKSKA